jgi:glutamyl-tRNA reductase
MSVLVVGLSYKGAPLATLERVALSGDALDKLLHDVSRADDVAGALVLSTCNRVEIYAEIDKFHGAVAAICELLSRHSQVPPADLTPFLYVHYQDRAVQHLLAVACGLDSMVIGESQILGQLRQALHLARERGTLGRALSDLGSLALRAGKRAQSQTSIGAAGASLVSVGLQVATRHLDGNGAASADGASSPAATALAGKQVLVVGTGAMSGLTVASVARAGATGLTVASRTLHRAQRLAASANGRAAEMSDLVAEMATADLVVTCTAASGHVITADMVVEALRLRAAAAGFEGSSGSLSGGSSGYVPPTVLVLLDLAMPRDVDPQVAELPGVIVTDLQTLAADGHPAFDPGEQEIGEVRRIMAEELASHMSARRAAAVTPTVVALRAKAAKVVDAEIARLAGRLDQLDGAAMDEIAKSMQRVTDKLLHDPTVRIKELAGSPGADTYEDALRVLFDLDPAAVQAVAQADAKLAGWPQVTTAPAGEGA